MGYGDDLYSPKSPLNRKGKRRNAIVRKILGASAATEIPVLCYVPAGFPLVPKSSLGTRVREAPASGPFLPSPANFHQSLLSRIISSTGISPMFSQINISALDRVLMNIVQLLPQHGFAFDDLRMTAFFPDLVSCVRFMLTFEGWLPS